MMAPQNWASYWDGMNRGWNVMRGLHGRAFDTGWTAMMGRGYAAQVSLAQLELHSGISAPARALAASVLTSRQAGLTRLRGWYRDWGGSSGNGWNQGSWGNWWNGWNGDCGCW